MKTINLNYLSFLTMANAKGLQIQYAESTDRYDLFVLEPNLSWETCILKDSEEAQDFEINYKSLANQPITPKSSDGLPKILSAVAIDNVSMYISGKYIEISGEINYIDSDFQDTIYLQGLNVFVKNADWGDTITVQVGYIHPINGWVSLKAFGESVPMMDSSEWKEYHYINNAISKIPSTIKIRFIYNQTNVNTVKKVIAHYVTHRQ
jgi:hypothetical protein